MDFQNTEKPKKRSHTLIGKQGRKKKDVLPMLIGGCIEIIYIEPEKEKSSQNSHNHDEPEKWKSSQNHHDYDGPKTA